MSENDATLQLAVIHETFAGDDGANRLDRRLGEAREQGAELAVLPELPLDRWFPATRVPSDDDAEAPEGPRHQAQADAARRAGLALLGGAVVREADGRRFNRALLFDARGETVATYDKLHVPSEEGFWESDHYDEGETLPRVVDGFPLRLGIQICSDLNRPEGCHLLGAAGAELVLAPRATPMETGERWKLVGRANAVTSACWVVSINRPEGDGSPAGGPSFAAAPDGSLVMETTEPLTVLSIDRAAVLQARKDYPGYLNVRRDLYARGWSELEG